MDHKKLITALLTSSEKCICLTLFIYKRPLTQKELAKFLAIKKQSVSRSIQSLVAKGVVEMTNDHKVTLKAPQAKRICEIVSAGMEQLTHSVNTRSTGANTTSTRVNTTLTGVNTTLTGVNTTLTEEGEVEEPPLRSPLPSSPIPSSTNPPIIPPENKKHIAHFCSNSCSNVEEDEQKYHFDVFWKHYPRKVGKKRTMPKYIAILKRGVDPQVILSGLQAVLPMWAEKSLEFIPHPSKWLDDERWEDEVIPLDAYCGKKEQAVVEEASGYSEDEERFFKVFGKRPRNPSEEKAFHLAFAEAVNELADVNLLIGCARLAVEDMREKEGDTNKLRRPQEWLRDRAYYDTIKRARDRLPKTLQRLSVCSQAWLAR